MTEGKNILKDKLIYMLTILIGKSRIRGANFSSTDIRQIMMNIILEHMTVIENKQTDAVTVNEKRAMWNEITEKFNALTGSNRNTESLKII